MAALTQTQIDNLDDIMCVVAQDVQLGTRLNAIEAAIGTAASDTTVAIGTADTTSVAIASASTATVAIGAGGGVVTIGKTGVTTANPGGLNITQALYVGGTAQFVNGTTAINCDGPIDHDDTLITATDMYNMVGTINTATAVVEGMDISMVQNIDRTTGSVHALKLSTTSRAGDSASAQNTIYTTCTDGGGSATHNMIYSDGAFDNFMMVSADGKGGVTLGSTMTVSPETTQEDGYITISVGATAYQIPIYAA